MKIIPISLALAAVLAAPAAALAQHDHANHQPGMTHVAPRQAEVAARGSHVMPFDLDRSTHVFAPRPNGGVQTVVSKDGTPAQVALIRSHLKQEAAAFARGDFASPAYIHGAAMPGLDALSRSAGRIRVAYEEVERGGRIRYVTADPALVSALHRWFEAQVSDHGAHATHGAADARPGSPTTR